MNLFEKLRAKRLSAYGLPATATDEEYEKAKRLRREEKETKESRIREAKNKKRFENGIARGIKIQNIYFSLIGKITGKEGYLLPQIAPIVKKFFSKLFKGLIEKREAKAALQKEKEHRNYEENAATAKVIQDEAKAEAAALKAQLAEEVKRLQAECEAKATAEGISVHKAIAIRSRYAKQIDGLEESVNEDIKIILKKANDRCKKIVRIGECSGNALPPRPVAKKLFYISMENRNVLEGFICVLPFIIGTLIFFAYPILLTVKLSFSQMTNQVGFQMAWLKGSHLFDNYYTALLSDTTFVPYLLDEMKNVLIKTPLIIVFSLILAMLVNKDIKGKGFFRVVFFLPFLLGTGQVLQQLTNLQVDQQVLSLANSDLLPTEILSYISDDVMTYINSFFSIIVLVLWNSGVQILLFLSGLQSIPSSLYEAARVDGATEWEMIWKITIPMISPIMLLNVIYTIVASFTDVNNKILTYLKTQAFTSRLYAKSAAMGWIYFMCILVIIGIVALLLGTYVRKFNSNGVGGKKKHGRV